MVSGGVVNSLQLSRVTCCVSRPQEFRGVGDRSFVVIRSDNMTVVSYINLQGGTHSNSLCLLAIDLWDWCLQRDIYLLEAHIPGDENLVLDSLSRGMFLISHQRGC